MGSTRTRVSPLLGEIYPPDDKHEDISVSWEKYIRTEYVKKILVCGIFTIDIHLSTTQPELEDLHSCVIIATQKHRRIHGFNFPAGLEHSGRHRVHHLCR